MFTEQPNFMPELGQIFLSNNSFYSDEAYWATEGLVLLKTIIDESKILEWQNENNYEGKVFAYRNYCWCDGDIPEHKDGCPPNFEFYPVDLKISWYKHEGRGITANIKELKAVTWWSILNECVNEIKGFEFN
jgi:hypothetical protein